MAQRAVRPSPELREQPSFSIEALPVRVLPVLDKAGQPPQRRAVLGLEPGAAIPHPSERQVMLFQLAEVQRVLVGGLGGRQHVDSMARALCVQDTNSSWLLIPNQASGKPTNRELAAAALH